MPRGDGDRERLPPPVDSVAQSEVRRHERWFVSRDCATLARPRPGARLRGAPRARRLERHAELVARAEAVGVAFYGVDRAALEASWAAHILSLWTTGKGTSRRAAAADEPLMGPLALLLVLPLPPAAAARATAVLAPAPAARVGQLVRRPDLGLEITPPAGYEPIPTQPDERWIALSFVAESPPESAIRPSLHVVLIPRQGEGVTDVETYVRAYLPGAVAEQQPGGRRRFGHDSRRFELAFPGHDLRGFVHAWESPERTVAVIATCSLASYPEHVSRWRRSAEQMKLTEPVAPTADRARLEREYARRRLSHPEYRIDVRMALVDGWQAVDTENYILVHSGVDEDLVERIAADVEILRGEFQRHFPPPAGFDAVATIRVCRDRDEYLAYGGVRTAVGYWNPATLELVFYDRVEGPREGVLAADDVLRVLYHEAFHQYIYHSAGALPPHSWFDEGIGDYFSGARVTDGRVERIDPNEWRLRTARDLVRRGQFTPWRELLEWDQKRFYANPTASYAQAWSMIYFLKHARAVADRPAWRAILPTYFDTLRREFPRELASFGGKRSRTAIDGAIEQARERALEAAFGDVDLDELERAWVAYVPTIESP